MDKLSLVIDLNDIQDFIDAKLYECDTIKPVAHGKLLHEIKGYEEALKDLQEFLKDKIK